MRHDQDAPIGHDGASLPISSSPHRVSEAARRCEIAETLRAVSKMLVLSFAWHNPGGHGSERLPFTAVRSSTGRTHSRRSREAARAGPGDYAVPLCRSRRRTAASDCEFNRSMQHTDRCVSSRSVADEVPHANLLHGRAEGLDAGALEARL